MLDRYNQATSEFKTKTKVSKETKQKQRNIKRDNQVKNIKKQRYSASQERIIKETDYTKKGVSPIAQTKIMDTSLNSVERDGLMTECSVDENGEPKRDPLTEAQLKNILKKCKNYELNV
jgi:hypothetical protein